MRLLDQLIADTPGFAPLIQRPLAHNTGATPGNLVERLEILKPLVQYENSVCGSPAKHLDFYSWVAYHSLTDAFILTQRQAAVRRIETSSNPAAQEQLALHANAERWISVGISHLTTSRQHLSQPVVTATPNARGWTISGTVPWVTAASGSQALVIAACDSHARNSQYLFYLPMNQGSVICGPNMRLLALEESCTCEVHMKEVQLSHREKLHGPSENVLSVSQAAGAGGLQTSALALGLAACVIDQIKAKSESISTIAAFDAKFTDRWLELHQRMLKASEGTAKTIDPAKIRKDANDLVLRVTQAALAIEKGAGYLADSNAARWVREALFFLVWSCPQTIANEHLCDLSHFDSIPPH